jgi:sensor histidine kinase YesM
MNVWTLYIVICSVVLVLMGLGLALAVFIPGIDRWNRRFFITFFIILFLNSCFSLVGIIFIDVPGTASVQIIANFWLSLLTIVPLPMLTIFLLHCCGENWRKSSLFRVEFALYGLYFILMVIAQFTTSIYFVTPDGHLHLGPLYPFIVVPLVVIALLSLTGLIRRRNRLTRKIFFAILIALLPMTVALNVHLFVSVFPFIHIGIAITALSMYGIILSDQIEQYLRQQQEIAHKNASILVLQMRPHFIHNTMLSIYYLCQQDPGEAQRVTLNFNTYLEKNLTALASTEPIPFSDELEHTQAYLNVEQALYSENLFVDYDTEHTRFRVPPLTLQPIVENAVKHGLDPDSDPLRISIRTRETDSGSEVIVSDNGPGFEPIDDNRPHIALANIRQRLELMCGGKMTIMPREGGGTVVKLTIP